MARVTHVKKAQQRYHTKPVIDPATGQQKVTPVLRKDGSPKLTKGGRAVVLRVTERDLDRPKPLLRCDSCGENIQLGTPYKWVEPHGRGQLTRHAGCPTWQEWELSNSLSARIAQIQHGEPEGDTVDDVKAWLEEKANEIRELASEKRDAFDNLPENFQQVSELGDIADQLEGWADEVEQTELPEEPEPEDEDCGECGGTGKVEGQDAEVNDIDDAGCGECDGTGQVTPEELSEEARDEWLDELRGAAIEALQNSPV
jgi:hypothetical protein